MHEVRMHDEEREAPKVVIIHVAETEEQAQQEIDEATQDDGE